MQKNFLSLLLTLSLSMLTAISWIPSTNAMLCQNQSIETIHRPNQLYTLHTYHRGNKEKRFNAPGFRLLVNPDGTLIAQRTQDIYPPSIKLINNKTQQIKMLEGPRSYELFKGFYFDKDSTAVRALAAKSPLEEPTVLQRWTETKRPKKFFELGELVTPANAEPHFLKTTIESGQEVKILHNQNNEQIASLRIPKDNFTSDWLYLSSLEKFVYINIDPSGENSLKILDLKGNELFSLPGSSLIGIAISHDQKRIAYSVPQSNRLHSVPHFLVNILDLQNYQSIEQCYFYTRPTSCALNYDGSVIIFGNQKGYVKILSTSGHFLPETKHILKEYDPIVSLTFDSKNRLFATNTRGAIAVFEPTAHLLSLIKAAPKIINPAQEPEQDEIDVNLQGLFEPEKP